METVQEQQLQLKMKFLLSYNKKIVVLRGGRRGGGEKFGGDIFPGGGRLSTRLKKID